MTSAEVIECVNTGSSIVLGKLGEISWFELLARITRGDVKIIKV